MRLWGRSVVLGPVNLTTHEEVGLLVGGFDTRPTVLTAYNPPFYASFVEAAGYRGAKDYLAFDWTPGTILSPAIERVGRQVDAGGHYRGIRIRSVDPGRFEEDARKLHFLYNTCFADLWGFVDLSWAEFRERAGEFRQFYHHDFVQLAERDGEPVGFALVLPNANEVLADLKGRLLPFGWLKARRRLPRIRTLRFILIGVRPDRTGAGLAAALVHRLREPVRRHGMKKVEVSLVQADNSKMLTLVKAMRCQQTKTYRLFRRDL
jgi:GNAT superfamily N-acetyltransferase